MTKIYQNLRPVGHITDQIGDLKRWRARRVKLKLEVKTLDTTIAYLEEYRKNVVELGDYRRLVPVMEALAKKAYRYENI